MLISVTRDLAFQRYFGNLKDIEGEIELLKGVSDRQVRRELARDLKVCASTNSESWGNTFREW